MVEIVQDLLSRLLVRNLLQLDESFSLSPPKTMNENLIPFLPLLPGQLKFLQLGDGRFDSLPADHILHLGRRALDQGVQDGCGA